MENHNLHPSKELKKLKTIIVVLVGIIAVLVGLLLMPSGTVSGLL